MHCLLLSYSIKVKYYFFALAIYLVNKDNVWIYKLRDGDWYHIELLKHIWITQGYILHSYTITDALAGTDWWFLQRICDVNGEIGHARIIKGEWKGKE